MAVPDRPITIPDTKLAGQITEIVRDKADVLADKEPHFHRGNFCSVIRGSTWKGLRAARSART